MTDQKRQFSAAWLVPLAVLFVIVWILIGTFQARGVAVVISFPDGHGLGRGDMVQCRGIEVGIVEAVQLNGQGVEVSVALDPSNADQLAREGSRWWISRPQVDWSRVSGLESIVGPRFVEVDPSTAPAGESPFMNVFQGLAEAPIIDDIAPGDLSLVLVAGNRGSLHSGSAVLYRGVRIGSILSTALAEDATGVIADVLIRARYAPLVRENSRFFQTGAFDVEIGLSGVRARLDSLETLLVGGVSLVTPTRFGEQVETGHVFAVDAEEDDDWLEWRPEIEIPPAD